MTGPSSPQTVGSCCSLSTGWAASPASRARRRAKSSSAPRKGFLHPVNAFGAPLMVSVRFFKGVAKPIVPQASNRDRRRSSYAPDR